MTPAEVYRALQQLARRSGRSTDEVLTLYGLERVLARLQETAYRDDFVLKGGVLLAAYALRRPTRDIDVPAIDFTVDQSHLLAVLQAIADTPATDGLTVHDRSAAVEQIRDQDEYGGLRVRFEASLHTARLHLALDVSTGDPIDPEPGRVVLPGLLGQDVSLRGYPLEMVVAEKAVTILQRGTTSTRWRDYVDLRNVARTRTFSADQLLTSARAVAEHRRTELGPIAHSWSATARSPRASGSLGAGPGTSTISAWPALIINSLRSAPSSIPSCAASWPMVRHGSRRHGRGGRHPERSARRSGQRWS